MLDTFFFFYRFLSSGRFLLWSDCIVLMLVIGIWLNVTVVQLLAMKILTCELCSGRHWTAVVSPEPNPPLNPLTGHLF